MSVFYDHSLVFSRWDPRACVAQFTSGSVLKFSLFRSLNLLWLRCSPSLSHCIRTLNSNQIHLILAFFCFRLYRFVCTEWMNRTQKKLFLVMCRQRNGINLWTCAIYEISFCRLSSLCFVLILILACANQTNSTQLAQNQKKFERMLECCVQMLVPVNYQP